MVRRPAGEEKESIVTEVPCTSCSSSACNVVEDVTGDFVLLVLLFLHIFESIFYLQSGSR